jgi:hypothetical protein
MPLTAEQPTPQRAIIIRGMALTLLFFAIISFVNRGINTAIGISDWSPLSFTISRFLYWLWLALIFVYVWQREHQPVLLWSEKRYRAGFYFASIFGMLFALFIGTNIISGLLMLFKLYLSAATPWLASASLAFVESVYLAHGGSGRGICFPGLPHAKGAAVF